MARRLKIISAYDKAFRPIGALCAKSIRVYAAVHDLDWAVFHGIPASRPPAWAKISYLIEEIRTGTHDFLLWVDADACFVRGDESILDHCDPSKHISVVNHVVRVARIPTWHGTFIYRERPNTGVMLVQSSAWSLEFLQRLWEHEQYIDHPWCDNAAFHDLIGYRDEISAGEQPNAPVAEIMARIGWLPANWNSVPTLIDDEPAAATPNPIITHFAGMPNDARLHAMSALSFQAISLGDLSRGPTRVPAASTTDGSCPPRGADARQ